MTTFDDMVFQLGGLPALAGVPFGPDSKYYFVDPNNSKASDSNAGTDLNKPLLSLEAAEAKCVANQHDTVFFIAGASADNPTASITWDKDYTHLIGIGSQIPGVGQRCRVVMQAATAVTPVITFAGDGCIIKNMQFNQEKATGAASGVAIVTGHRNYFENVFFMCPTSATAASYSLKVGGTENAFVRCTIGQHTNVRSAATYGLWLYVGDDDCHRNKFIDCEFLSWATGGGTAHALVYVDVDIDVEVYTAFFENCLFDNIGAATLAVAIDDNCAETDHQIILRGRNNCFAQCTAVADPLTYVLTPDMNGDHATSGLLMITVTET
jgi:hypothetical protein